MLTSINPAPSLAANLQVVAGAAAPGDTYKPVEVGEVAMDLTIGREAGGGNLIRGRTVMIGDLPGFKVWALFHDQSQGLGTVRTMHICCV